MKKWVVQTKKADFDDISRKFGISPILARVIRNRDIIEEEDINLFLNGDLSMLYNPFLLKDMDKAVDTIKKAISENKKIRIVGDYDIDGVCATTILVRALSSIGANVSSKLPDRIVDGYGINKNIIKAAYDDGIDLIVTCDNGIAAYEEVEYANSLGIEVVVTDHHEIPFEKDGDDIKYIIPNAVAVVDPHQPGCKYPYKNICGGMVAYKLVMALGNVEKELIDSLLAFAAFSTVGDIMPLCDENRIIVKYGLEAIKNTNNVGLNALISVNEVDRKRLSAYHLGFILGPCVNAIGRLESAEKALKLFLTESEPIALALATELKETNDIRKQMMEVKIKEASEMVETGDLKGNIPTNSDVNFHDFSKDSVLVIYLEECHESIAGLIAGRIKERFYKPTIVLTKTENGAKGSGRSIEAYDMFEELSKCKRLFDKFGGHPMAAGLSMPIENINELRKELNDKSKLTEDDLIEKLKIDIPMPINKVSMNLVRELERLEPYGNGNPSPLFAQKNLKILSRRASKNRNMVFMNLHSDECYGLPAVNMEAKYFTDADKFFSDIEGKNEISICYTPDINSYMGVETLQVNIKEWYN